jgi:hypothetical protein
VLIDGSGKVIGGAGGKLNGKTFSKVKSKSKDVEKKDNSPKSSNNLTESKKSDKVTSQSKQNSEGTKMDTSKGRVAHILSLAKENDLKATEENFNGETYITVESDGLGHETEVVVYPGGQIDVVEGKGRLAELINEYKRSIPMQSRLPSIDTFRDDFSDSELNDVISNYIELKKDSNVDAAKYYNEVAVKKGFKTEKRSALEQLLKWEWNSKDEAAK